VTVPRVLIVICRTDLNPDLIPDSNPRSPFASNEVVNLW